MRKIPESLLELDSFKTSLQTFASDMGATPSDSLSENLVNISGEFHFMSQLVDDLIVLTGYVIDWNNLQIITRVTQYNSELGITEILFHMYIESGPNYNPVSASNPNYLPINLVNTQNENEVYSIVGVQNNSWGGFTTTFYELLPLGEYKLTFSAEDLCLTEDFNNVSPNPVTVDNISVVPWYTPFPVVGLYYNEGTNSTDIRVTRDNFYWEFLDELDSANIQSISIGESISDRTELSVISTSNLINGVQITVQGQYPGPLDNIIGITVGGGKMRIFGSLITNPEDLGGFFAQISQGGA